MSGFGDKPFGLRAIKLKPLPGGAVVDLPVERVLTFRERVLSGSQRGWMSTAKIVAVTDVVEFELEAGGISLEAYALMTGRTVTTSGTTPRQIARMGGLAGERLPEFMVIGQAMSDEGDIACRLFKCTLTAGLGGSFQDGQFFMAATKGIAVDDGMNGVFEFVQQETAKAVGAWTVQSSVIGGVDYVQS